VSEPRLETVSTAAGLDGLEPEWDGLVCAMPRPSPFLLHGWVRAWWSHYGPARELAVACARRDGRLVGLLPLCIERRGGLRVATFLGGRESALADVLLASGEPVDTAGALLAEAGRAPFQLVDLFGLPADSRLAAAAPAGAVSVVERVEAPVLDMPDGWEAAYTARTGSKKRNLHRRRLRQLREAGEVEFAVARDGAELASALEEAFSLHALRFHDRPDDSTFGTSRGHDFHREAFARLAPLGVARIVTLRVDGRAIAFHSYLALEGTMYVHRLAFDPAFSRFSPGLVTTLQALATASAEGLVRAEFLGGDERYKLELADRMEPLYEAIGLGRGLSGRAASAARVRGIVARRRLKRSQLVRRLYAGSIARPRRAGRAPADA
jgi:CelD/BcsL family acetyltransferase involved in cellulose biosynthesis